MWRAARLLVPAAAGLRHFRLVGVYKIDWLFVKPAPEPSQSSSMAPEFGRTLGAVNTSLGMRISDHSPIVVTVPIKRWSG